MIQLSDMKNWYIDMVDSGISENRAAQMAGMFAIADCIENGLSSIAKTLGNEKSLGALDLHTLHIEDALNNIARAIESEE